jgi:hypothetical protein
MRILALLYANSFPKHHCFSTKKKTLWTSPVCLLLVRVCLKTKISTEMVWNKRCLFYTAKSFSTFFQKVIQQTLVLRD